MTKTKTQARKSSRGPIEWEYEIGPPRRSWRWYTLVIAIGLGVSGLLWVASPEDSWSATAMLIWTCCMIAFSLAPDRSFEAMLDENLFSVRDAKRHRIVIQRDLADYATYSMTERPADRFNPRRRRLLLRKKHGRAITEVVLPGGSADDAIMACIAGVISPAPDLASTWSQRLDAHIERWIGWR